MPLLLGMGLMICCHYYPSKDTGREFLAAMFFMFTMLGCFCIWAETQSSNQS